PSFGSLIERLQNASPEFRASWPRHEVAPAASGTKRMRHGVLGDLTLTHVVLTLADDPEQKLVTCTAGGPDQDRIAALLATSAQPPEQSPAPSTGHNGSPARRLLTAYRPQDDEESADVERVRGLTETSHDPWSRMLPLHLTASALIVDPDRKRVLLRWHQRQQAWLQVGGHGDPGEQDALAIALREAGEGPGPARPAPW